MLIEALSLRVYDAPIVLTSTGQQNKPLPKPISTYLQWEPEPALIYFPLSITLRQYALKIMFKVYNCDFFSGNKCNQTQSWRILSIFIMKLYIVWCRVKQDEISHYSDVTMSAMASQITAAFRPFVQSFVQAHIKESIKAPRDWPLWGESTGDRWIPLAKGQ